MRERPQTWSCLDVALRARLLTKKACRRERACCEPPADSRIFVGDAGFETRASPQVSAAPAKSCLGKHVQGEFAHVHLEWCGKLTVCFCLRKIEGVPTLRSCVPLMGDCVQGAGLQGLQLRAAQRGRAAGEGGCTPLRGRSYLPVASETSTRQEAALLVVFYRDESQTARRHGKCNI